MFPVDVMRATSNRAHELAMRDALEHLRRIAYPDGRTVVHRSTLDLMGKYGGWEADELLAALAKHGQIMIRTRADGRQTYHLPEEYLLK